MPGLGGGGGVGAGGGVSPYPILWERGGGNMRHRPSIYTHVFICRLYIYIYVYLYCALVDFGIRQELLLGFALWLHTGHLRVGAGLHS